MGNKGWWRALAAVALAGCSSEEPAPVDVTERIDEAQLLSGATAKGSISHLLAHSRVIMTAGVEGALAADQTAGANGDAVAKQYLASKTTCPGLTVTHGPGSDTVKIVLPANGCKLAGVSVSGLVTVTVKIEAAVAVAQFVLQSVKVDATQIDGTATESTSDGKTFTSEIKKMVVDKTTYTFSGTFAKDTDGAGSTSNGAGTALAAGESAAAAFLIQGLHHKLEGCYADAGQLVWTQQTALTAPAALKGKLVSAVTTLQFDADSPRDGSVDATVQLGAGKASAKKEVILPKYGTCPDGTAP